MKGLYRRNLPHIEKFHACYFVTFRTNGDLFLPPAARSIALKHCLYEHRRRVDMHACVIMPNHVHLLFTPQEKDDIPEPYWLAEIMKGIKGVSARRINQLLGRRGQLWQDESFDRIMRREEFEKRLCYIIANPIDAGLARKPGEYPWCWQEPAQAGVPVPHKSLAARAVQTPNKRSHG